jgi:hypothetical protein
MHEARVETVRPAGAPVVPMAPMNPPGVKGGSGGDDASGGPGLRAVGSEVAGEVASQVRDRASEAAGEKVAEAGSWATSTAEDLHDIATELRDRGRDRPARIADMAGDGIEQAGQYLRDTSPDAMVNDVRGFARQQPVAFAAAAAVVGLAVARVVRATTSTGSRSG